MGERQTDAHTDTQTRVTNSLYISPPLRLARNVLSFPFLNVSTVFRGRSSRQRASPPLNLSARAFCVMIRRAGVIDGRGARRPNGSSERRSDC